MPRCGHQRIGISDRERSYSFWSLLQSIREARKITPKLEEKTRLSAKMLSRISFDPAACLTGGFSRKILCLPVGDRQRKRELFFLTGTTDFFDAARLLPADYGKTQAAAGFLDSYFANRQKRGEIFLAGQSPALLPRTDGGRAHP